MSIDSNIPFTTVNVRGVAHSRKQLLLKILLLEDGIDVPAVEESEYRSDLGKSSTSVYNNVKFTTGSDFVFLKKCRFC